MAQPGRTIVIVLSDGATPNSIAMFGLLSFPFDFHQICTRATAGGAAIFKFNAAIFKAMWITHTH